MTPLTDPLQENFALLVAGGLTPIKAYVQAGFAAHNACTDARRLMRDNDVKRRIGELQAENAKRPKASTAIRRVADVSGRMQEWQEVWDEVRAAIAAIIAERAARMSDKQAGSSGEGPDQVAGGATGFITTEYKGREGEIEVHRVDGGLIQLYKLLLSIGRRASEELGQWGKEHALVEPIPPQPDYTKLTD